VRLPDGGAGAPVLAGVIALGACALVGVLFAYRFGDLAGWRLGLLARGLAVLAFATLGGALASAVFARLRGVGFRGLAIFPLDLVRIDRHALHVTPFGSLRSARVLASGVAPGGDTRESSEVGGVATLILSFEDGSEHRLPFASEAAAEALYRAIEAAQNQLEILTIAPDLERAVLLDPFFEIRGDAAFSGAARARKSPILAPAMGALFFCGIGLLATNVRDRLSERALVDKLFASANVALWEQYRVGGGDRFVATREIDRLERQHADAAIERQSVESDLSHAKERLAKTTFPAHLSDTSDAKLPAGYAETRAAWQERVLAQLTRQHAHAGFQQVVTEVFARARRVGDRRLMVVVASPAGETAARDFAAALNEAIPELLMEISVLYEDGPLRNSAGLAEVARLASSRRCRFADVRTVVGPAGDDAPCVFVEGGDALRLAGTSPPSDGAPRLKLREFKDLHGYLWGAPAAAAKGVDAGPAERRPVGESAARYLLGLESPPVDPPSAGKLR
jgi:hypothetical protein